MSFLQSSSISTFTSRKIWNFQDGHASKVFIRTGICLLASFFLSACFQGPEASSELATQEKAGASVTLERSETLSPEVCAAKIESTLESRREIVSTLERPIYSGDDDEWYNVIDRLTESELTFPCMDASLREKYSVLEGSNVVFDDHALSPEMATYTFGQVNIAIRNKPYIVVARNTKLSLVKVVRDPPLDDNSYVLNTLEIVDSLRGELPKTFDVLQLVNGDYSKGIPVGSTELEASDETTIWTFCRLRNGTFFSVPIDNEIYDGPGGLELLRDRLALADEWDGDDACPDDWNEGVEKSSP